MKNPDPNCDNCNGTGWIPAISIRYNFHGDGRHDCFCVLEEPEEELCPKCGAYMEILDEKTGTWKKCPSCVCGIKP